MNSNKTVRIALAGNPNCGKTTIFNNITGAKQHVGNYPGVTVEKKRRPPVVQRRRSSFYRSAGYIQPDGPFPRRSGGSECYYQR